MTDQLAVWVAAIRAHEKHTPECASLVNPLAGDRDDDDFLGSLCAKGPCDCDQSQRADARLARVLQHAIDCGAAAMTEAYGTQWGSVHLKAAQKHQAAALAVVERAAQPEAGE